MKKFTFLITIFLLYGNGLSKAMTTEQLPELEITPREQELGLQKGYLNDIFMNTLLTSFPIKTQKTLASLIFRLSNKKCIPPSCIIFEGEPGIGKTTLAQIIAQKTGRFFKFIKATDLFTKYQNSGSENLKREIEPLLNADKPIIIILDEITRITMYHDDEHKKEYDASMQLWLILDACKQHRNICIIGTTNDSSNIPEQVKQRLGMSIISLPKPTIKSVKNILIYHILGSCIKSSSITFDNVLYLANKLGPVSPRVVENVFIEAYNNALQDNVENPELEFKHFFEPVRKLKKTGLLDKIKNGFIYAQKNKLKITKESLPYISTIIGLIGLYFTIKNYYFAQHSHKIQVDFQQKNQASQAAFQEFSAYGTLTSLELQARGVGMPIKPDSYKKMNAALSEFRKLTASL